MTVSATKVMELRKITGAGAMDCKKFLLAADGDIAVAITEMRKAGQAKADKKADRVAAEGVVVIARSPNLQQAVMLEINSETDFVARDVNFIRFAEDAAHIALESGVQTVEDLAKQQGPDQLSIEEARQRLLTSIGEHIKIRRLVRLDAPDGVVGFYLHGSRIGVLVALHHGEDALGRDVAMHIAASRPLVVARDEVAPAVIAHEREIFIAQARDSGKPQAIIDKMIDGRMSKFLDDVSLYGQVFVKNPDIKVGQLLEQHGAQVRSFVRFEVGEGIEKKEDNFVAEVMAQVRDTL